MQARQQNKIWDSECSEWGLKIPPKQGLAELEYLGYRFPTMGANFNHQCTRILNMWSWRPPGNLLLSFYAIWAPGASFLLAMPLPLAESFKGFRRFLQGPCIYIMRTMFENNHPLNLTYGLLHRRHVGFLLFYLQAKLSCNFPPFMNHRALAGVG